MTWNELLYRIEHHIPENRREEKAVFCDPETGFEMEIDDISLNDGEPIQIVDPNLPDDKLPYMLTP